MCIRQYFKNENGQRTAYWALVESYRTATGPRQRVIAWLGKLDEAGRLGVLRAAEEAKQSAAQDNQHGRQQPLNHQLQFEFDEDPTPQPRWVEVNAVGVRVENLRQFGGPWMALHLIRTLQLDTFLQNVMEEGKETVPWDVTSLILIVARLFEPSSELYVSEQWYPKTSMPDLLGVSEDQVDDNRLYRCLDKLLPHKEALEVHLKNRMGELFDLEYDLLMYDVTSTFFEGRADFPLAQRGYSRDQRSDCKQVCIALVVSKCGIPLGDEVFVGNTADVSTVEHIVEMMEARYGKSDRIWVMDRGMVSEDNIEFLRDGGRRYTGSHFVCFVAYVLWKTLGQMCSKAGLGHEPRRILAELSDISSMDVVLPTRSGPEIRTRCISKPTDHQQILLEKLGLKLPAKIIQRKM